MARGSRSRALRDLAAATLAATLLIYAIPSWTGPAVVAAPARTWLVRDVGLTALSHDTVCHQYDEAAMTRLVGYVAQFHANYASESVPLDDASGFNCRVGPLSPDAYLRAWTQTIHLAGLHVLYRGSWNHWAGSFGQAKLSYSTSPAVPYESSGGLAAVLQGVDTTSYIGLTYEWILRHADLFQDGDIFEPFGEPQNNGITDGPRGTSAAHCPKSVCQFPSTASFNQWMSDFAQADQAAFKSIGKNVISGWFGLAGDSYTYVTPQALVYSGFYNVDHFTIDFTRFTSQLQASWNAFHKPIVVEWGDTMEGGAQPATANTTDRILGWLAQQPYIAGVEYWQLSGNTNTAPERAIDLSTGMPTSTGQVLAKWFGAMTAPSEQTRRPYVRSNIAFQLIPGAVRRKSTRTVSAA